MNNNRWISLVLLILLLIAGIIGAGFFLLKKSQIDLDKDQALKQIQSYILEKDHKSAYKLAEELVVKYPQDDNLASLKKALSELLGESNNLDGNLAQSSITSDKLNDNFGQGVIEPITPRPDHAENIFSSSEPQNKNSVPNSSKETTPTPIREEDFKSSLVNGLIPNTDSSNKENQDLTPIKKPEPPKVVEAEKPITITPPQKEEPAKEQPQRTEEPPKEPSIPAIAPPVQEVPKEEPKKVEETPKTPSKPAPTTEEQKRNNEERRVKVQLYEALDAIQTGNLKEAADKLDKLVKEGSIEPDYKKIIDLLNEGKQNESRRQMENLLDSGVIFPFIDLDGAKKPEERASSFNAKEIENMDFSNPKEREQAKKELDQHLKENPKDADAIGLLASLTEAEGNTPRAIELYEQALAITPNADDYYAVGNLYFHQKLYEKAIENYSDSIKLDNKNARAYNNRGISYVILGEDEKATASFKEATKADPKYANGYYQLGRVQKRNNDLKGALASFQSAYNIDKSQISTIAELANTYLELDQNKEADQYYTLALKIDPNNESLLFNSAQTKFYLGQNKEALSAIEKALVSSPNNTSYRLLRGEILDTMGEKEKAISDYEFVRKQDSSEIISRINLGAIYTQQQKLSEAETVLKEAQKIEAKNGLLLNNLGALANEQKKFKEAIDYLTQAVAIGVEEANFNLGIAYIEEGNYEKAKETFSKVISQEPNNLDALYSLGLAEYKLGNDKEGQTHFEKILKANPDYDKKEEINQLLNNKS